MEFAFLCPWSRSHFLSNRFSLSSPSSLPFPPYIPAKTAKPNFRYSQRFPFGSSNSVRKPTSATPEAKESGPDSETEDNEGRVSTLKNLIESSLSSEGNFAILSSCFVGLITGIAVVIFNNSVHELRDFFWDGIPSRGAPWLREEPIEEIWKRVVFVPACGGLIVGVLNVIRDAIKEGRQKMGDSAVGTMKAALRPVFKAVAAGVTLGTGNSLGPEGPSVEIGSSIAKGIGKVFDKRSQKRLSLVAAGSAAGISSGFNAAVAGCFFAVESVLWPSPAESSLSLTNATSMVILSAVIASVVSEIGLGSEPAFKVPEYDFRSPTELPLYLLLGVLCGLVSLTLSRCTSYMLKSVDYIQKTTGTPKAFFPVIGGFSIGLIALAYPEILYWGFENVDLLLESRPFVKGVSADLLLQLVAVKIVATSLCRASGLVGGYYAPSLFIGAATGMAYGKFISFAVGQPNPVIHFSFLEVASPQAYGLVGMAATLAGVCQVPLTAVLLLFELTQDYRIVLPLLGAVGFSSWITSGQTKRDGRDTKMVKVGDITKAQEPELSSDTSAILTSQQLSKDDSYTSNLCDVESSLCLEDTNLANVEPQRKIFVSEAMRTRYVKVLMSTSLTEAIALMLAEKQSCALIVDNDNMLEGILTLGDIQEFSKFAKGRSRGSKELLVSEMCSLSIKPCQIPLAATPSMDLLSAQNIMTGQGVNQIPVVQEHVEDRRGHPVGILDRECISLTYRALAARRNLSSEDQLDRETLSKKD